MKNKLEILRSFLVSPTGIIRNKKTGKVLNGYLQSKGYLQIKTCDKGRKESYSIHRLVATVFLPNPLNLPQVNHKNAIKTDNRVANLEWCNASHNVKHSISLGLNKGRQILTPKNVKAIRRSSIPVIQLAEKYGVSYSCIYGAKNGYNWKHI